MIEYKNKAIVDKLRGKVVELEMELERTVEALDDAYATILERERAIEKLRALRDRDVDEINSLKDKVSNLVGLSDRQVGRVRDLLLRLRELQYGQEQVRKIIDG